VIWEGVAQPHETVVTIVAVFPCIKGMAVQTMKCDYAKHRMTTKLISRLIEVSQLTQLDHRRIKR